jgi:hypothetical protein
VLIGQGMKAIVVGFFFPSPLFIFSFLSSLFEVVSLNILLNGQKLRADVG